jgi:4'-phosphopantetheinyl transferase
MIKTMVLPQIFLYKRETFLTQREINGLCFQLTAEEKNKIRRFKNRKDAENFLIGKIMQRNLIASLIEGSPGKLIFGLTEYGRPFLKFPRIKNFDFNLSHSGDYVAMAVTKGSVGIDLEKIGRFDVEMAVDYLTEEELKYLNSRRNKTLERFYQLWVLKESFVKANGKGLSFPLKKVNFKFNDRDRPILKLKYPNKKWFFRIYEIDKNYKMAVCSNRNRFPSKINFMNNNSIREILP